MPFSSPRREKALSRLHHVLPQCAEPSIRLYAACASRRTSNNFAAVFPVAPGHRMCMRCARGGGEGVWVGRALPD